MMKIVFIGACQCTSMSVLLKWFTQWLIASELRDSEFRINMFSDFPEIWTANPPNVDLNSRFHFLSSWLITSNIRVPCMGANKHYCCQQDIIKTMYTFRVLLMALRLTRSPHCDGLISPSDFILIRPFKLLINSRLALSLPLKGAFEVVSTNGFSS